jgi:hypothetical protein
MVMDDLLMNIFVLLWIGKSDPWVKLTYNEQTNETEVIKNSQEPTWNECFFFPFVLHPHFLLLFP